MNSEQPGGLALQVPRDPGAIADAAEKVGVYCRQHGCPAESGFRLQLGVAETLNNLYQHGNNRVEDAACEWLFLRARSTSNRSSVLICLKADIGPVDLPEAALPEWSAEQGRGLYILQNWLDTFQQRPYRDHVLWRLAVRY